MNDKRIEPDLSILDESQRSRFRDFAKYLRNYNEKINLTAITDLKGIYLRHFADSLYPLDLIKNVKYESGARPCLIDIGSGAGLPGIPLAISLNNWPITSLEATGKKAEFQIDMKEKLKLVNFSVINARAEKLAHNTDHRHKYDIVTARAVGPLARIAELGLAFLKKEGKMLVWKGAKVESELPEAEKTISICGAEITDHIHYNFAELNEILNMPQSKPEPADLRLIVLKKIKKTPLNIPRTYSEIKKSPL